MAPPAPAPAPAPLADEIAAIEERENAMDDAEYVNTAEGQESARALISRISPGTGTPPPVVQSAFAALEPQYQRIVKAYLRRKLSKKQKLNKREANVLQAIGV